MVSILRMVDPPETHQSPFPDGSLVITSSFPSPVQDRTVYALDQADTLESTWRQMQEGTWATLAERPTLKTVTREDGVKSKSSRLEQVEGREVEESEADVEGGGWRDMGSNAMKSQK